MDKFTADLERIVTNLSSNLHDTLKDLESSRLKILNNTKKFLIGFILSIIALIIFFVFVSNNHIFIICIAFILISFVIYYFWIGGDKNDLIFYFKHKVVPRIVNEFLQKAHFDSDAMISESQYNKSNIFRTSYDRYSGDTFISGILGNTSLQFSKLHTEYEIKSKKSSAWRTIFKGIFFIADSNKRFNNEVYIFPDFAERAFGGFGRWMQEKRGNIQKCEMVYLENPEFEKRFVVYATDPIEARYLLTPSMQEYFLQLSNHIGKRDIHASFIDGKLYLALSGRFDLFYFRMDKSLLKAETIRYYCQNLGNILSIVEILDLNTRIWGK
ncbi:MAG TPA: hypothetical protein DIT04_04845 [Dysgonomonas sp.]|nr:hypothetical protein [Dysgonomonas sp.]